MANQNYYSFAEAMANAKEAKHSGRYNNSTAAHESWTAKRPVATGIDAIEAYYYSWRKDISYNAYCAVEWALFGDDWRDLCEF